MENVISILLRMPKRLRTGAGEDALRSKYRIRFYIDYEPAGFIPEAIKTGNGITG